VFVLGLSIVLTLALFPLSSVYDLTLALLPWLVCVWALNGRQNWIARSLLMLVLSLPIVSWAIVMWFPSLFEQGQLRFDAVVADKVIVPVVLLIVFVYLGRNPAAIQKRFLK
jgi:hypothetical protein